MNDPKTITTEVRTTYWHRNRWCEYRTKRETPMHSSIREQCPARTEVRRYDPSVPWAFGCYCEIIAVIANSQYDEQRRQERKERVAARKQWYMVRPTVCFDLRSEGGAA